ncbi:hypothetical protein Tco_0167517 [Tanacetum coccineum]
MEIVPDELEVTVDVIPLATKPQTIIDWKIHKEGKKSYYQIIRADGSLKGRIVGIKSLLEVTAVKVLVTVAKHKLELLVTTASNVSTARLVLLVQKLLLLVLKVNVAGIKVTTAERLQLLKG